MKTHEQQDSRNAADGSVPEPTKKRGRRRFLGAGAAATPFLLTLFSQPALGGLCFTPSRALSRNTSLSQAAKNGDCTGISPGNYKTQTGGAANNWPSACPPGTPFHPLFKQGILAGTYFLTGTAPNIRSMTMLEVLNFTNGQSDPNKTAFHIIGAYLNCLNNFIPANILTAQLVRDIWSAYATKGYYEPTAGVQWNGAAIVLYLTSNFIAP